MFFNNTVVEISAANIAGCTFEYWEVDGVNISTDSTLILTIDGPYEVTAVYSEIENYKISGFSTWIIFGILGISSSKNTKKQF